MDPGRQIYLSNNKNFWPIMIFEQNQKKFPEKKISENLFLKNTIFLKTF